MDRTWCGCWTKCEFDKRVSCGGGWGCKLRTERITVPSGARCFPDRLCNIFINIQECLRSQY